MRMVSGDLHSRSPILTRTGGGLFVGTDGGYTGTDVHDLVKISSPS